jgi:hypothetical protein
MKRIGLGLMMALVCSIGFAQGVIPEVDTAEVVRRGDMVVIAGEGPRNDGTEAFLAAMAPPADDSDKWFVTVITTKDCAASDALKSDFRKAQELLAFVAAPEQAKAWAHYNEYSAQDATQSWRLKEYKIASYPTLIIQLPRNGMWGDPKVVVFQQSGYNGKPADLANAIRATVKAFAAKIAAKMGQKGFPHLAIRSQSLAEGGSRQSGVDPPFVQPPQVDPFNPQYVTPTTPSVPNVYPPPATPTVQPVTPSQPILPGGLLSLLPTLMLTILAGLKTYQMFITPITPTKADDLIVPIVLGFLERLTKDQTVPPTPPSPTA